MFLTTGGPKFFYWFLGNRFKKLIKKDILGFFGVKAKVFHLGTARELTDEHLSKIKSLVKKGLDYFY